MSALKNFLGYIFPSICIEGLKWKLVGASLGGKTVRARLLCENNEVFAGMIRVVGDSP